MSIKPTIKISLHQRNAPKLLMHQLVKLLPMNDMQLEGAIKKEVEENPFLSFPKTASINIDDIHIDNDSYKTPSLYKILLPQIKVEFKHPEDKKIALSILESIDEDGFLRNNPSQPSINYYDILVRLQRLQPAGVFSRNLAEFYRSYLYSEDKLTDKWELFLEELHNIATGDTSRVISLVGSQSTLDIMIHDLKYLPRSPDIHSSITKHIIPDLICKKKDNRFQVKLKSNIHSSLNVQESYVSDVRSNNISAKDKAFITEKFSSAKWLKTALEMRAETLLNVAVILVNHQDDYLRGGQLKPLTLKYVSELSNVHISTVSRIVNNKYIICNIGTIPLKSFFSVKVFDGLSQSAVMNKLKEIVAKETETKIVLNDEKIVSLLAMEDINIARRTVAKYREMCQIEPSNIRKRKLNKLK